MMAFVNIAKVRRSVVDFPMKVSVMWQHFKSQIVLSEKQEEKLPFCYFLPLSKLVGKRVYSHPSWPTETRPGKGNVSEIRENKIL